MVTEDPWQLLEQVRDPELPMVSVVDLGIVRGVRADGDTIEVDVTPTYSGCPATDVIRRDIESALSHSFAHVTVRTVLHPAWTSDWITPAGRERLATAGIAPPPAVAATSGARRITTPLALVDRRAAPTCPQCGSDATEELSQFGSTACKSLWRCTACREPFDAFKAI